MKLSIITTIPHYFAILYTKDDYTYTTIIFLSTTFSILWHAYEEPENIIKIFDYILAVLVTLYEIYSKTQYISVFTLNMIVLLLNKTCSPKSKAHCLWHIISSLKYIYISRYID